MTEVAYGAPAPFKVHKVEVKKGLPARDGKPPKVILKLGLESQQGEKFWAELFNDEPPATFPKEGSTETFIIEAPKQEGWAANARRPSRGGGAPRGRSPADTKRIERMAAHKVAAIICGPANGEVSDDYLAQFKVVTDWLVKDLP